MDFRVPDEKSLLFLWGHHASSPKPKSSKALVFIDLLIPKRRSQNMLRAQLVYLQFNHIKITESKTHGKLSDP